MHSRSIKTSVLIQKFQDSQNADALKRLILHLIKDAELEELPSFLYTAVTSFPELDCFSALVDKRNGGFKIVYSNVWVLRSQLLTGSPSLFEVPRDIPNPAKVRGPSALKVQTSEMPSDGFTFQSNSLKGLVSESEYSFASKDRENGFPETKKPEQSIFYIHSKNPTEGYSLELSISPLVGLAFTILGLTQVVLSSN